MAVETIGGKPETVIVPAGTTVEVTSGPKDGDRFVDVLWNEHAVRMFAIDLKHRGEERFA